YDEKPKIKNYAGGGNGHEHNQGACLPFFDQEENLVLINNGGEVDITPPAPAIEAFGQAVNKVCGAAGKVTTKEEFKQLMREHPKVLADLMDYTGNKVFGDRNVLGSKEDYLEDLTEAWYAIHAFDHIFCGEPTGTNKIGGLHFHGRYQQLQASGEACRLPVNFKRNEVVPGSIYSMGVRMKRAEGDWAHFPIKGYGLTLSAADILKVVTRGFAENPTDSNSSTGCILAVNDGGVKYDTVLVRRAKGLRTFFPDATPDYQRNPACANPLTLKANTGSLDTQPARRDSEDDSRGDSRIITNGRFNVEVITSDEKGITLRITEED
ncbi:MAG: hypothetical protein D3909_09980, partial [Candidatus Electrothrix sp. ATG1]|nr:hypothetical protein [Candidatus Electrothrix sp. ATG1]